MHRQRAVSPPDYSSPQLPSTGLPPEFASGEYEPSQKKMKNMGNFGNNAHIQKKAFQELLGDQNFHYFPSRNGLLGSSPDGNLSSRYGHWNDQERRINRLKNMLKDCREEMEEMEKERKIELEQLERGYRDQIKGMEDREEKLKDRIAELEFKLHEVAERTDDQIKYYKKEMEKDRRAYDKKNDEFNELQKSYRILETVKNQLENKMNKQIKKMAVAEEENAVHMGMIILQERNELRQRHKNEMAEVRGQLAAADEAMINERIEKEDYKKLVDQLHKKLDEEKDKNTQQQVKLDEMEKAEKERAQMLLDIGQLRMENDILRTNITNRDEEIEQTMVQINKLKKKLRKVEKNTAQEKVDLQNQLETMDFEAKARQDEANGTIENLEAEIQKMTGNVETITQEKLTLLAELTELHEEVNSLLKSIDEKERKRELEKQKDAEKIEKLKKENDQMKTDKEAMQEAVDRLAEEHRRIANLH